MLLKNLFSELYGIICVCLEMQQSRQAEKQTLFKHIVIYANANQKDRETSWTSC